MDCCGCCATAEDQKEAENEVTLPPPKSVKSMPVAALSTVCQESKNVFAVCVNVMKNYLGTPYYPYLTYPRQLYPYIRYLCGEENVATKSGLLEDEIKRVYVTLVLREGKIVHPKFSAFSRVYCKILVSNGRTEYSSIKENETNLFWDEVFKLDIPSYENNTITIEVWSADPQQLTDTPSYVHEGKSQEAAAKSYRIGSITEPVKNLPCVGREMLWTVRKGPRKMNTRGQISLFVQLGTPKGPDHVLHVIMQMEILKQCYVKQLPSLQNNKKWKNWLEVLPNAALTLLQQHALQHGITPTEQCVCSWIVASALKIHQEDRISFYFLYTLLEGLIADIYDDPIEPYLEEALSNEAFKFAEFNKAALGNLHESFEVQIIEEADELFYLLKSMCGVEMQTYSNYLDSYVVIAGESYSWYLSVFVQYQDDLKENDTSVEIVCDILMKIIKVFLKNQIILDDIFTRAWSVSYSKITFNELDTVISDTIKPIIQHLMILMRDPDRKRVIKESLQLLQLYHNVRNLVQYVLNDLPSERAVLAMDEYSSWFGEDLILEWFLLCDMYTKPFIKRAVVADNMERMNTNIPHGTSVPDVVSIVDEMVLDVWTKLTWEEQFYTHAALLDAVRTCVMDYVQAVYDKLCTEDFYGAKKDLGINEKGNGTYQLGKFFYFGQGRSGKLTSTCWWEPCKALETVLHSREMDKYILLSTLFNDFVIDSFQLCVAMSNTYAVFEHLYVTKNKIKGILRVAESKYGFTIMDPMASIGNQMQIEISAIYLIILDLESVKKIFEKFIKRVLRGTLDIFMSSSTIIAEACAYIEKVLEILYLNLKAETFYIVLRHVWILAISSVKRGLGYYKRCSFLVFRKKTAFVAALQTLTQLQEIFYCDGHGLSYQELRNPIFEELKQKIEVKLKIQDKTLLQKAYLCV